MQNKLTQFMTGIACAMLFLPFASLSQIADPCDCTNGCTIRIDSAYTGNITVMDGDKLCIGPNGVVDGIITVAPFGTVCNQGVIWGEAVFETMSSCSSPAVHPTCDVHRFCNYGELHWKKVTPGAHSRISNYGVMRICGNISVPKSFLFDNYAGACLYFDGDMAGVPGAASQFTWDGSVTVKGGFVSSIPNIYIVGSVKIGGDLDINSNAKITLRNGSCLDVGGMLDLNSIGTITGEAGGTALLTVGTSIDVSDATVMGPNMDVCIAGDPSARPVICCAGTVNPGITWCTSPITCPPHTDCAWNCCQDITVQEIHTDPSCGNTDGTATITVIGGSSPYAYLWNDGATSKDRTGLSPGTYYITVTDVDTCEGIVPFNVVEEPCGPTVVVTDDETCPGDCGTIEATPTNGTAPYTYVWSDGSLSGPGPHSVCPTITTTYTVTVTDFNGGTGIGSGTVTVLVPPTVTVTPGPVSCNGQCDGSASATPAGTAPFTYLWSNNGTTQTISGLCPGPYSVTVTDAKGCTNTQSGTVTEPTPIVLAPASIDATCGNTDGSVTVTATGGTPGYTYMWSTNGTSMSQTNLGGGTYTVTVTDANGCQAITTADVNESGAPSATTVGVDPLCFGDNDGSVDLTATGGNPAYTFVWSNSATTEDISGLIPGTYTVTVTDALGCLTIVNQVISEPPALTLTTLPTHLLCAGDASGSITATAGGGTPGYTYLWNTNGTGATIGGLSGATYSVTVTDANGCTISVSETVIEPAPMTITSSPDLNVCPDDDPTSTINVTVGGGIPGYTYIWSPGGETNASITVTNVINTSTTYYVTATDGNGCVITEEVTILSACTPFVVLTDTVYCNGGCAVIQESAAGGAPPYTYTWSDASLTGPGPHSVCPTTTTSYCVTITDQNGEMSDDCMTVTVNNPPTLTTSGLDATCGQCDGNVAVIATGSVTPYSYIWSNGCITAGCGSICPGSYTVTVTDANGCTVTAVQNIGNLNAPVISATGSSVLCFGDCTAQVDVTVTSPGTPPYTYLWSDGQVGTSATGMCAGTYTVTITDANGCISMANAAVTEPPAQTVTSSSLDEICNNCEGEATTAGSGGTPGFTYVWSTGETSDLITGLCSDNYSVTVTDANGCTLTDVVSVGNNDILPNAGFDSDPAEVNILSPLINFTDKSTGAVSWYWDFGDGGTSVLPNPTHTYTDTGCYDVSLIISNQYGCRDSIPQVVCVKDVTSIYVPNAFSPNGDGDNEFFTIEQYNFCEFELLIFDRWGNLIFETTSMLGWDGTANGGSEIQQEDVYVWKIKGVDCYGEVWNRIGHVTLIR